MLFCFCCCPPQGRELLLRSLRTQEFRHYHQAVAVPRRGASCYDTIHEVAENPDMKLLSPTGARVVTYCYYNTRFAPTQPILHILCRTAAKP